MTLISNPLKKLGKKLPKSYRANKKNILTKMYQKRIIFQSFGQERFLDAPTYTFLTSDTTILQFFLIIISQVS
jgi:hypothetical protein